jgi:hypothetical protein
MPDIPTPQGIRKERLDQYSRFLGPTLPKGDDEWYNKIRQLMGKELSLAKLDKEDILSYLNSIQTAQVFLLHGQEVMGRRIMVDIVSELKLTGSIEGTIIENIFSNRIEYEQTQHVHEHLEPQPKKSFWRRK